jgi:hypothetical protein
MALNFCWDHPVVDKVVSNWGSLKEAEKGGDIDPYLIRNGFPDASRALNVKKKIFLGRP